jgi:hypothetical protein
MSSVDLVNQALELWDQEFSDIPFLRQSISLSTSPFGFSAHNWRLYIQGDAANYEIQALCDLRPICESMFSVKVSPGDSAIIVSVNPLLIGDITLTVHQNGAKKVAQILCLAMPVDSNEYIVIYNSKDREKCLLQKLHMILYSNPDTSSSYLLDALTELVNANISGLLRRIELNERSRRLSSILKPFLKKYELQYNAHGLKRTFSFWSPFEKIDYINSVVELMNFLEEIAPNSVSLGFGAVLGQIRDNDLVPHDDDLDVLVAFDSNEVSTISYGLEIIKDKLNNSSWSVQGRFFSHLWVGLPNGRRVDVFVGLREKNDFLSFYPSSRHSLKWTDVFPAKSQSLCGISVLMPADQERYLAATYGLDWKTPKVNFSHPWDRKQYLDIAGISKTPIITTRGEINTRSH